MGRSSWDTFSIFLFFVNLGGSLFVTFLENACHIFCYVHSRRRHRCLQMTMLPTNFAFGTISSFVMISIFFFLSIAQTGALATPKIVAGQQNILRLQQFPAFARTAEESFTTTIKERPTITDRPIRTSSPISRQQHLPKTDHNTPDHWELRLYNDEFNHEFWVAAQLVKITGLTELQAFQTMKTADETGEATIGTYECRELGERYHHLLQAEGLSVKLLPVHVLA